jgi:uncharacterized protein YutE (UPF0331/DUF86 family)
MMNRALEREAILPRVDGILKNIEKLETLAKLPLKEFSEGDPYDLAQHHLRLALEGIFHISTHILSRVPGGRAVEYKEVARKMGSFGFVPKEFAAKKMVKMAGMRNLLVHAYSDIDPKHLYKIAKKHLDDVRLFLKHIKTIVQNPVKFGLKIS